MSQTRMVLPAAMQAIVQDGYGTVGVSRIATVPVPRMAADEVLVSVSAAGVDRGTWHLMVGEPYVMRLGTGLRPRRATPGRDLAGVVVAIGDEVTGFGVGDEVLGIGASAFAQYAIAKPSKLVHRPDGLSVEKAAALPTSGLTAMQAVHDVAKVERGQRVLILGASGGVGSFAVQMARAAGAHVTGVCSASKADLVTSLGTDRVLDYRSDDLARDTTRYDVVINIAGRPSIARLREMTAPNGTAVMIGGEGGGAVTGGFGQHLRAAALSPFVSQRLRMMIATESGDDLQRLVDMTGTGEVSTAVERTFDLPEAPLAVDHVASGRARGKVVVSIPQEDR